MRIPASLEDYQADCEYINQSHRDYLLNKHACYRQQIMNDYIELKRTNPAKAEEWFRNFVCHELTRDELENLKYLC